MAEERASHASKPVEQMLVITRVFDAPRELVFKAWTRSEHLIHWWGPKGFTTPFCKADVRPGGVFHYCMRSPEGRDFWGRGVYREIVAPERIVYTDSFADEKGNPVPPTHYGMSVEHPSETLVTVTFAELDGKTTLTLRHDIPESVPESAGARQGWTEMLDRLAEHVAPKSSPVAEPWLVITRVFDAPPERVFKAWTQPAHFVHWWGPQGYTTPVCEIDLRPGGVIRFCMRSPEGRDLWCGGVFREIIEPSRLVFDQYFTDEKGNPVSPTHYGMGADIPLQNVITVTFAEDQGKTKLTMQQTIPESIAARHGAPQGWSQSFDRLAEYLAQ